MVLIHFFNQSLRWLGTDHYFSGGGVRNIVKRGLKSEDKLFADVIG